MESCGYTYIFGHSLYVDKIINNNNIIYIKSNDEHFFSMYIR